ncbi:Bug family tripartite tricarboxylate transporter substrate binding protein [Halarsenatibacter silvermanii]|uniref:Tripartite-type tricarboxylate transporter, receptor component TctC n=1 Tax=Halarsenatibacter silvermanii TaxID=321763 RepID=A0A1G9T1S6_9FIRM|nr:tripartite tricarboxylate transporter substrate binding protein [Halarsenatibacter silvermanii]SDM41592.1 Tripartite-type tricarboxylate transporter, receptor component TctC [Halarsenatibacter silvermanii]
MIKKLGNKVFIAFLSIALVLTLGFAVSGEEFPQDTIEFTVPWSPGGGSDTLMRIVSPYLEDELGTDIVIHNRPGASGTVGLEEHYNEPDTGYYIGQVHEGLIVSHYADITDLNFDDFELVAGITNSPQYLAVADHTPYDTFPEFVEYAQENPEEVTAGVTMMGIPHLQIMMLEEAIDADFSYVGYEGTGERVEAIAGGHVDIIPVDYASGYEYVEGDYIDFIAQASDERQDELPDLKTIQEYGYDVTWRIVRSVVVPPGTSDERIEVLEDALAEIAEDEEFQQDIRDAGAEVFYMSSEDLEEYYTEFDEMAEELMDQ